ncbi:hypothetical protein QBC34DRAFT_435424 [Podospora aff. communis PSN243]|uniref:Uncharacterized protein n=1 Tax=Podospora aff. communis PSN243 TaxID=3040156 RepID=A0AAV9GWA7_9PEZI|nr:hypothetical protein QBC34DRAFT_435424 [Podospora aff. communis PSN243]
MSGKQNLTTAAETCVSVADHPITRSLTSGKTPAQHNRERFMEAADRLFPTKKAAKAKTAHPAKAAVVAKNEATKNKTDAAPTRPTLAC